MAKFYQKNNLQLGIAISLILSMSVYFILTSLYALLAQKGMVHNNLSSSFSERTIGLLAIAVNVIPMRYYQKHRIWGRTMQGVTIAMALLSIIWMIFYLPGMLGV